MLARGAVSLAKAVLLSLPRWPVAVPTYRKPQIPAARGTPLQIAVAPRVRHAVGNKSFYSWPNPLFQNWDSQGRAVARVWGLA